MSNRFFLFLLSSLLLSTTLFYGCKSKRTTKDVVNTFITRESIKNINLALELYHNEFGEYPVTLDELLFRKGIQDRSIIEDAWGKTYHYTKLDDTYIIFSLGGDGKPYTPDDVHP